MCLLYKPNSTRTRTLLLQSYACDGWGAWFSVVLFEYARPSLKEMLSIGAYVALKPQNSVLFSIDSAFPDVHQLALMQPIRDAGF